MDIGGVGLVCAGDDQINQANDGCLTGHIFEAFNIIIAIEEAAAASVFDNLVK